VKKKNYFHFLFVRLIVCLAVGLAVFILSVLMLKNFYNESINEGIYVLDDSYMYMVESYADGEMEKADFYDPGYYNNTDYFRFVEINDNGSFDTLYETDFNIIAVQPEYHKLVYIIDDDNFDDYPWVLSLNNDLTVEYRKCQEIDTILERMDMKASHSYKLLGYAGSFGIGNGIYKWISDASLNCRHSGMAVESYYIDYEYLHLGKVKERWDSNDFRTSGTEKLFGKSWDFTDESKKELYVENEDKNMTVYYHDGNAVMVYYPDFWIGGKHERPDAFFEQEGEVFLAKSMNDYRENQSYSSAKISQFLSANDYTAEIGPDNGYITRGRIRKIEYNGRKFLIEYVVTYMTYGEYYKPFFISLAVILLILSAVISSLLAIKPYRMHKKEYINVKPVPEAKEDAAPVDIIDTTTNSLKNSLHELGDYAKALKDTDDTEKKTGYYTAILDKMTEIDIGIDEITGKEDKKGKKST